MQPVGYRNARLSGHSVSGRIWSVVWWRHVAPECWFLSAGEYRSVSFIWKKWSRMQAFGFTVGWLSRCSKRSVDRSLTHVRPDRNQTARRQEGQAPTWTDQHIRMRFTRSIVMPPVLNSSGGDARKNRMSSEFFFFWIISQSCLANTSSFSQTTEKPASSCSTGAPRLPVQDKKPERADSFMEDNAHCFRDGSEKKIFHWNKFSSNGR